jgi:hypothetical protein
MNTRSILDNINKHFENTPLVAIERRRHEDWTNAITLIDVDKAEEVVEFAIYDEVAVYMSELPNTIIGEGNLYLKDNK